MGLTTENFLLIGSVLLFVSVMAGKTSYRFGVPTLVFFLATGMLAGSDGIGKIPFDSPQAAQFIGIVALNFILFSGGLDTRWKEIKPVLGQGIVLSTIGVFITAITVGLFVWQVVPGFSLFEGLLLGSIVSSTDSAAVFSILRSKNTALKYNLKPTLELESGSNDPMAYVLTIACIQLVQNGGSNGWGIVWLLLTQISIGAVMGFVCGFLGKVAINRLRMDYAGLYTVLVVAIMFFTVSFTDFIGGNGFLAVYLSALYLGNQDIIHKKSIIQAFDGFAWLMQIVLFLTLGLLVFPSQIVPVIGIGLLVSAFMIVVARPIAVWLCLVFFKVRSTSKWFISWVGLRGAVPIVFATYPLIAGVDKANMIFNIVFFISLSSVIIQGTTLPVVARWLGVAAPERKNMVMNVDLGDSVKSESAEITLPEGCWACGQKIVDLGLPKTALIAMIKRGPHYITPNGSTKLEDHDELLIFSEDEKCLTEVYRRLGLEKRPDEEGAQPA